MKPWYKKPHKSTHTAVLYLASTELLKHSRSHITHVRIHVHNETEGKARPPNPLAHGLTATVSRKQMSGKQAHHATLPALHGPLPRPHGTSRTRTAPPASSSSTTGTGSTGPYSQPAQRVPDSELARPPRDSPANPRRQAQFYTSMPPKWHRRCGPSLRRL